MRATIFPMAPGRSGSYPPQHSFAVTLLESDVDAGSEMVLTLGDGNDLVCRTIELLGSALVGREIEERVADFGRVSDWHVARTSPS
jgi:L-fuconate dehydratase